MNKVFSKLKSLTKPLAPAVALFLLLSSVAFAYPVTVNYTGAQGPWEHVRNGDARPPTLVASGLIAGSEVKMTSVSGTWSARIYHGHSQLEQVCGNQNTGISFTNEANNTIATYTQPQAANGVTVPQGATRLYAHVVDAAGAYFDNSGNRDNRAACSATFSIVAPTLAQCADGIDNDGDGATDMNDFSCSSNTDNDETNPKAQCQDGIDNDGDGKVDMADPGCSSPQDNTENTDGTPTPTPTPPPVAQCADGIDNDGDGKVDMADPGCKNQYDNDERDKVCHWWFGCPTPTPTPTATPYPTPTPTATPYPTPTPTPTPYPTPTPTPTATPYPPTPTPPHCWSGCTPKPPKPGSGSVWNKVIPYDWNAWKSMW